MKTLLDMIVRGQQLRVASGWKEHISASLLNFLLVNWILTRCAL